MSRHTRKRNGSTSGLTQIWKFWRHCCCRFGWFPLLVAPLVTASCLLDLYSSFDCEFIQVNVGFMPSNDAWNQSTASLGLFQFHAMDEANLWDDLTVKGCNRYSGGFESQFIEGDRTWEVTRIMAYISAIGGIVATLTCWLLVFTPIPAGFFWPGVLLPSLIISFLCEGSKFLFLDASACRSALWYPSGTASLPQVAESCELGKTSYFAIAAAVCFFISLVLVCVVSPKKRELDEDFGEEIVYAEGSAEIAAGFEGDTLNELDLNLSNIYPDESFIVVQKHGEYDYASSLGDNRSCGYSYAGAIDNVLYNDKDMEQGSMGEGRDASTGGSPSNYSVEKRDDNTIDLISKPAAATMADLPSRHEKTVEPPKGTRVISQARLSKAESMESMQRHTHNSSDELIDKCLMELTRSFQTDELDLPQPKSS